jgi:hypothetical protein
METIRRLNQMNLHKQFPYEQLEDSSNYIKHSSDDIRIKLESNSSSLSSSFSTTSLNSTCSNFDSAICLNKNVENNVENIEELKEQEQALRLDKSTQTILGSYKNQAFSSSELSSSDENTSVNIESSGIDSDFEFSEEESDQMDQQLIRKKRFVNKNLIKFKFRRNHEDQKKYLKYLNRILKKLACLNSN